ncbi:MAG: TlpA disulfide reductase family protein [Chitinophagaceae bacterium]
MRKLAMVFCGMVLLASCNNNPASTKDFTVTGSIENNTAKMIYLEEVPASMMQPTVVDSGKIEKDGKFTLHTGIRESVVYNLRLDQNKYPIASIINDAAKITIKIKLNKENNQFAETYEVEGSPASLQMKDFMVAMNNDLQKIFYNSVYVDSLHKSGAPDSVLFPLMANQQVLTDKIKNYSIEALSKANDPALILFELGYYQSTANGTGFGLQPLDNDYVTNVISEGVKKFPAHKGIADVYKSLTTQVEEMSPVNWVGKEAPDFSLPDVNGKEVKLSSFRGKYVLVDFWASWCMPCRMENPNVVKAYNQYKDKNFTVLGVSLDRPGQKDAWMKAIYDDGLTWTQVSDLKYWESSVIPLYHFNGIPFNVLVDPEGKVVAQGLKGSALEGKLAEVIK